MSLRHWLQLSMTEGIGPILMARLVEAAGGVEPACQASVALLRSVEGIGGAKAAQIFESLKRAAADVDAELDRAARGGVTLISRDDDVYPALLREIPDPPAVLYARGELQPRDLNALAIVGSRRCSFYGREQAERFGALLSGAALTVVSGGARGVDSSAHRGALSHPQGRTIAVLGSGADVSYPPENEKLFDEIVGGRGAVISEYPMGTPPVPENFPRRNRIVSGMSRGVLVVEADERSGALITARQACEDHGRPVFAVPGRVDNKLSAGPHRLIREGATLVTCLDEILEGLAPLPASVVEPSLFVSEAPDAKPQAAVTEDVVGLSEQQRAILLQMDGDPLDVDTIIERSQLPAHVVMGELTFLTLRGVVQRVDGQRFAKRIGSAR
jgi:DNA processing protein